MAPAASRTLDPAELQAELEADAVSRFEYNAGAGMHDEC